MPPASKTGVRFRNRAELLDFLLEVAAATGETLDLDQLLENVAGIIKEVIPFDLFALLLYSERVGGLRIRYAIGHREEVVRNMVLSLGEGLTGVAAATRQTILAGDVRSDPRYLGVVDAVRSELAVPMVARGKLVGVIDLQSTRLNAYTPQDRSLLQLLATRVAVAIDNARLYRRVVRQNLTLRTLAGLSQEFSSILALEELMAKIAQAVKGLINYDAFSIYLVDEDQGLLRNYFNQRFDQRGRTDNIPLGLGITGAAVAARQPVRVDDTLADPRYIATYPGILSEVAVPLVLRDRVIGVMDLESEKLGFFTEDHVRTLSLLAPQIASSVENARLYEELARRERRMEEDLKAARKLQQVLLPRKAPAIPGLEAAVRARPAREITGDIYDFFRYGAEGALMCFGDSSGKGAAAALYGATVSGLLRSLAAEHTSPGVLLRTLNDALLERKVDAQYVTLVLIGWKPASREMVMANAGSAPPMLCRGGEIIRPKVAGIPLGLLDDREYDEVRIEAQPGDVVLLFSDGVEDQSNGTDEEYGQKRLAKMLERTAGAGAGEIAEAIFADLDEFSAGTPIADDQTLVALKVL